MKTIFTLKFWFNLNPGTLSPIFLKILISATVLSLFFTILFKVLRKTGKDQLIKPVQYKLYNFFFANFMLGLLWIFFSYERVPLLTARFWYVVWLIGNLVWIYFIAVEAAKIPEKRKQLAKELEYKKYIP
jgi:hypothetical protein